MARQNSSRPISTIQEEEEEEEVEVRGSPRRVTISNKIELIPGKKSKLKSILSSRSRKTKEKQNNALNNRTISVKDRGCNRRSFSPGRGQVYDRQSVLENNIRVIEVNPRLKAETVDCGTQTIESAIREEKEINARFDEGDIDNKHQGKGSSNSLNALKEEESIVRLSNDIVARQPEVLFLLQENKNQDQTVRKDSRFKEIVQTLPDRIATRPWVAVDAKAVKENWIQLLEAEEKGLPLRRIQSATTRKVSDQNNIVRVQSARAIPASQIRDRSRNISKASPRSFVLVSQLAQQMAMRGKTAIGISSSSQQTQQASVTNQPPAYIMQRPPLGPRTPNRPKSAPQKLNIFKGHPGVQALSHVRPDGDTNNDATNQIHKEYNPKLQKISLQMTDFRKPNSIIKLNLSYASSSLEGDGARIISEDIKRFHQKKEKMISHGIKTIERRLETQKKAREERKIRLQQEELRKKREEEEREQGRKYNTSRFFSTYKDLRAGDESHLTFSEKRAERQKRIERRTSIMGQRGQRLHQVATKAIR